jgi:excisionase family DNA binding protein
MQNPRTISQIINEAESTGPKALPMGAPQFPPFSTERIYTTEEIAAYLRCEVRTVCNFIADGRLSASRVGRRWLVSERSLNAFLIEAQKPGSIKID